MESLLWNLLVLFLLVVLVIFLFYKYQFSYWRNRQVLHMTPKFPLGNILWKKHMLHSLQRMYENLKTKDVFAGGYFFFNPIALITDLDLVRDVLIKDFHNFTDRGYFYNEKDDPISASLITLDGEKWKNLRTKLTPTFRPSKVKFMYPTIVKVAYELASTISEMIEINNEIEIKDLVARYTTDVIGTCAFGIECNSLKNPTAEFRIFNRKFLEEPKDSTFAIIFKTYFRNFARWLGMKLVNEDVSAFFIKVVRETVQHREEHNIKRNDFMDLLIELKNGTSDDENSNKLEKLTLDEIAANTFLFSLAGYETSSITLGFGFYELAGNQEVQDRARKEIEEVLERHDENFSYDALMEMTYLEQVLSEILRKYPPIVFLFRLAKEDYYVSANKRVIEKGTHVVIPNHAIQHDKNIYPNPEVFDPERFTTEAIKARHPMTFLSFGDGPRNCIAARLGRIQTKIALAVLIKNFKFSYCPKTPKEIEFDYKNQALGSVGGIYLNAKTV